MSDSKWQKKDFETIDPETGLPTGAALKVTEDGVITDFLHGREQDRAGGKHGHVWNLDKEPEEIGGREPTDSSGKSIYQDD
jgi:hypothetical protein